MKFFHHSFRSHSSHFPPPPTSSTRQSSFMTRKLSRKKKSKMAERKVADNKMADSKMAENKPADNKVDDSKIYDVKTAYKEGYDLDDPNNVNHFLIHIGGSQLSPSREPTRTTASRSTASNRSPIMAPPQSEMSRTDPAVSFQRESLLWSRPF